jgi:general stress protein 26
MAGSLEELYGHIEDIEIAMMTTRRRDGHLRSRAMATQKRAAGADLWFVTLGDSAKVDDLRHDSHVNLTYYKDRTREWVSISGVAALTHDRARIRELYASDWAAWFPKGDDPRHGTPEDPRMELIAVTIHGAEYLVVDQPQPVVLYEVVKGWLLGTTPDVGEMKHIGS